MAFDADVLDIEIKPNSTMRWQKSAKTDLQRVEVLIHLLQRSKTGTKLVEKAREKAWQHGQTLTDAISPGEVSITDTTLVRRFSPSNPSEMVYETKSHVFINRDHRLVDALLDLAHELTHYNYKGPFNPYEGNFSAEDFVASTLEAKGGEIEAYLVECQVMKELMPNYSRESSNCHLVRDPQSDKLSKNLAAQRFYSLGDHYDDFMREAAKIGMSTQATARANKDTAHFISSAYSLPYPLAALREYATIMQKVCQNDQRRLTYMRDSIGRSLASVQREDGGSDGEGASQKNIIYRKMQFSYETRCHAFNADGLK
jgi:hypothetical protein